MKRFNWKSLTPHIIAVGVFLIVAVIYCKPALQGKVLQQSDVIHWKAMAANSEAYKATHGHYPLWSNGMFCGMPAFQIAMDVKNPFNIFYIQHIITLFLPKPINFFFLLCIGFYFLTQILRLDYRIGILSALGYAYASFSAILVVAGHETQIQAMAYMPFILGSIILIYHRKYLIGASLTALFMGLLIAINHLQVTYYLMIVTGFMSIYYLVNWIKKKEYKHAVTALVLTVGASLFGIATNLTTLATTYDYSKATMRSGTLNLDTVNDKQAASTGLDIDYAFQWSYGQAETFSLLIPNVYGGSSEGGTLNEKSNFAKQLQQLGAPEDQSAQFAANIPTYWGNQPFTSGPVYLGAIICFLFFLGAVYLKDNNKWWMIAACFLAILMSWGKNFIGFNSFLFNYLPLYNKFRVPSYTLIIPQFLFVLLGAMALNQFLFKETDKKYALKKLMQTAYVILGIFVIAGMLYTSLSYKSDTDSSLVSRLTQQTGGNSEVANTLYNALVQDRQSLFGSDLIRSLFFAASAFLLLWLFIKDKIKAAYALLAIVALSSIDVIAESRRYLNDDRFLADDNYQTSFAPSAADQQIMQDTGYYRMIDFTKDVFNDASPALFHNDVGGYNPAKLALIQDVITYQISKQPMNFNALNMLNTKYFVVPGAQGQPQVQQNPEAFGACWFANNILFVNDAAAAMKALNTLQSKDTAIVESAYKSSIPFMPQTDSVAAIRLIKNDNDDITYESNSSTNQFAVFSEIFYDRGWKAYIDNKETPILKANYALRGLAVPAGKHNIRFEFRPASYYKTTSITVAASALIWLLLVFLAIKTFILKKKEDPAK